MVRARSVPFLLVSLLLGGCGRGDPGVQSVDGKLTWAVDFDAEAEARGLEDCSYTRTYDGLTDRSAPWLCSDCDAVFRVESRLKGADCYAQISAEPASEVEWVGWAGRSFRRAPAENFALGELGEVAADGSRHEVHGELGARDLDGGGAYALTVDGTLGTGPGRGDPMWGLEPPDRYACGWRQADPEPYAGDWRLQLGAPIPDGWFPDACGEGVRLHDQLGQYVVIAISAIDCPPCRDMAEQEEAFLADARAAGVEVGVVTLLAPTLGGVLDPTSTEQLAAWTTTYGLSMPVLADRGWGFWLGYEALGEDLGYPTVLVVAPDGELLAIESGFGGWDRLLAQIQAD